MGVEAKAVVRAVRAAAADQSLAVETETAVVSVPAEESVGASAPAEETVGASAPVEALPAEAAWEAEEGDVKTADPLVAPVTPSAARDRCVCRRARLPGGPPFSACRVAAATATALQTSFANWVSFASTSLVRRANACRDPSTMVVRRAHLRSRHATRRGPVASTGKPVSMVAVRRVRFSHRLPARLTRCSCRGASTRLPVVRTRPSACQEAQGARPTSTRCAAPNTPRSAISVNCRMQARSSCTQASAWRARVCTAKCKAQGLFTAAMARANSTVAILALNAAAFACRNARRSEPASTHGTANMPPSSHARPTVAPRVRWSRRASTMPASTTASKT